MGNRCFKCGKEIGDNEISCDNKRCIEALKEFDKVIKKIGSNKYKKFKKVNKVKVPSELETIVEKTTKEKRVLS